MAATVTPAPTLAKREGYIWGFISGNPNSPLSCPGSLTPTLNGGSGDSFGCCDQASCVGAYNLCNDFLGTRCPEAGVCSEVYGTWLQCDAKTPSCVDYIRVTDNQDAGITSFGCGLTGSTVEVLVSPTSGGTPTATTTSTGGFGSGGGDFGGSSSTNPFVSDPSGSSSSSGVGNLFEGNSGTGSGTSSSNAGRLTTGEIVGIAIGGLVVVFIVGSGIWSLRKFCQDFRRRRMVKGEPSRYAATDYEYTMNQFMRD